MGYRSHWTVAHSATAQDRGGWKEKKKESIAQKCTDSK